MKRTFEDLLKISNELQKLYDKKQNIKDLNMQNLLLLEVRAHIINGIQNGNFYNYDDADTIADKFDLNKENWSKFGCSEFNFNR